VHRFHDDFVRVTDDPLTHTNSVTAKRHCFNFCLVIWIATYGGGFMYSYYKL